MRPKASNGYVEHPRYGKTPNFTGLNVDPGDKSVYLHCSATWSENSIVPETAVEADLAHQNFSVMPITHYVDIETRCHECLRLFLFYALEQKYWFEELKFDQGADCFHCSECRKGRQSLRKLRDRYRELVAKPDLSEGEQFELATASLDLVESAVFRESPLDKVRQFLNLYPDHSKSDFLRNRLKIVAGIVEERQIELEKLRVI